MTETAALIQTKLKVFRVKHMAMVMGSMVYGLMVLYIHQYAPVPPSITDAQTLTTIEFSLVFYIMGLMAIAAMMRKNMLNSDTMFKQRESINEPSDQPPFFANYLSSLFVVWAVIEAIVIGGVVLFLTSGELTIPLIMIAIGVVVKLANGPRRDELMQLAAKHKDAA